MRKDTSILIRYDKIRVIPKTLKMVSDSLVLWWTSKRLKVVRIAFDPKQAQLIPCTVALYDKGGTIQRAGCQLSGDKLRWLNKEP